MRALLQLQLERSITEVAASSGRPTIVVFDRGMLDGKAFMGDAMWARALDELDAPSILGRAGTTMHRSVVC